MKRAYQPPTLRELPADDPLIAASGSVVVHLKDGRAIDLSGRTPAEAIAHLRGLGVSSDAIDRTVHQVGRKP